MFSDLKCFEYSGTCIQFGYMTDLVHAAYWSLLAGSSSAEVKLYCPLPSTDAAFCSPHYEKCDVYIYLVCCFINLGVSLFPLPCFQACSLEFLFEFVVCDFILLLCMNCVKPVFNWKTKPTLTFLYLHLFTFLQSQMRRLIPLSLLCSKYEAIVRRHAKSH